MVSKSARVFLFTAGDKRPEKLEEGKGGVKKREKRMLYSQPMSQRRTGRVSQRPSFKNKTLSPPCLHLQPCLASTPPAGVHSASPPLCTAPASLRLPQPPGKQQRGGDEEKPALISSLKTLLAPYLWRTFNSALPQAALPPPRSAR